jgi:hypothetical protein
MAHIVNFPALKPNMPRVASSGVAAAMTDGGNSSSSFGRIIGIKEKVP